MKRKYLLRKARCTDAVVPKIVAIPYKIGFFLQRSVLVTEEYNNKEEAEARMAQIIERHGNEIILFKDKKYTKDKGEKL